MSECAKIAHLERVIVEVRTAAIRERYGAIPIVWHGTNLQIARNRNGR